MQTIPLLEQFPQISYSNSADARHKQGAGTVIGATAWFFSHRDCPGVVDYLFVDEAGQVSVANLVAMSAASKNLRAAWRSDAIRAANRRQAPR